jgi:hypothetical protein
MAYYKRPSIELASYLKYHIAESQIIFFFNVINIQCHENIHFMLICHRCKLHLLDSI